jgi:hypothetical protein
MTAVPIMFVISTLIALVFAFASGDCEGYAQYWKNQLKNKKVSSSEIRKFLSLILPKLANIALLIILFIFLFQSGRVSRLLQTKNR